MKNEDKTLFMLVADTHRQFGHKIREIEKKNGYGMCVNCILLELIKHGDLTQVELVDKIHMRPPTISVALQKMEADGLITRSIKDEDQRCTIVKITKKGLAVCEETRKQIRKLDDTITKQIDPKQLEIAKKVLIQLKEAFKEDEYENI